MRLDLGESFETENEKLWKKDERKYRMKCVAGVFKFGFYTCLMVLALGTALTTELWIMRWLSFGLMCFFQYRCFIKAFSVGLYLSIAVRCERSRIDGDSYKSYAYEYCETVKMTR